jgi:hypothetical protein
MLERWRGLVLLSEQDRIAHHRPGNGRVACDMTGKPWIA